MTYDRHWIDEDAGPLVRPYAMTRGRTKPANIALDMITVVMTARLEFDRLGIEEEYIELLELCRQPMSVAELAARLDVPMVVVKVLLSDMIERGEVVTRQPSGSTSQATDITILQAVLDGVRRL
jgi:hypothetical protein